jgi:hydrogenase-1 operon protein HyaF
MAHDEHTGSMGGVNRPNPMQWLNEEQPEGVFLNASNDGLALIGVPEPMRRRRVMIDANAEATPFLRRTLSEVRDALMAVAASGTVAQFDVSAMTGAEQAMLLDALGDGDVSVVAGHDPVWQASETALTGVWQVRVTDALGDARLIGIEVGPVPSCVMETARELGRHMPNLPAVPPQGVMNALPVLAEIAERADAWQPGMASHVINFTLLPMTPEDMEFLMGALGRIPLTIVSGGYGTSRIIGTAVRNVFGVQYLNSTGQVILDTMEIGGVPASALAAREDFEDSAQRLTEIMEAYL